MKKIYRKEQIGALDGYPKEVVTAVEQIIVILDENYGENRNVDNDLGGYILIAENIVVIEMLKKDRLHGLVPEYMDVIEISNGKNYTSSLYLLSSDFAIVVVTTEELSKFLLE